VFGYKPKPNFSVEDEQQIQQPPTVDFGAPATQPQQVPQPQAPTPQPAPAGG
jgi:LemA protein